MALATRAAELVPDQAFATSIAYAHRRFEPVLGRVPELVAPNLTAVDVGAWYGPWTYWLARRARAVVTIEANPALAAFVDRTAPPNVRVVHAAAADEKGTAELWLPPGGKGTEGRASLSELPGGRPVSVDTIRIDDLDLTDVGLIKVDVEGHEAAALRGAEGTVRRYRPTMVVEVEYAHGSAAECLELLDAWGYEGYFYRDRRWHRLASFDLAEHQRQMAPQLPSSYLRSLFRTSQRYVNTVVFWPRPTASAAA
jgi:FkbM family methyltransferase